MVSKYLIYALVDPRDLQWRYIGETERNIKTRVRAHITKAIQIDKITGKFKNNAPKDIWLRKLDKLGLKPNYEILEELPDRDSMNKAEIDWIAEARRQGVKLTNILDGGDGGIKSRKPNISDDEVIRLYSQGKNSWEIARENRTCRKRVLQIIKNNNLTRKGKLTPQDKREIIEQYKNGIPTKIIASKFNIHPSLVCLYRKEAGIPVNITKIMIIDEGGRVFDSITDAAAFYSTKSSQISRVIKGHRTHWHGHKFWVKK